MIADRFRLRSALRQLSRGESDHRPGKKGQRRRGAAISTWDDLDRAIEASCQKADQREAAFPKVTYPEELPISQKREEIRQAIQENQVIVLCGETGSGKTTQLPKLCLEMGLGKHGYIGHTQPRRLAARTVAQRIADELRVPLGEQVGYQVRFGDHTKEDTLIKLMTDGILLAETQHDRFLNQYEVLIIDEAHERSLNIDFLLGYLSNILTKRTDLKIIITSATIDPDSFSKHFNSAPVLNVSGRTYPVEVRYRQPEPDEDSGEVDMSEAVADAAEELMSEGQGDILAFFQGEREILDTAEVLNGRFSNKVDVLPLFARLSNDEQNRVFKTGGRRRIVLATNVAETSLTVPGIRYVIDTGLARISRYASRSGVQRLPVEPISQASANQRKGRCGRVAPGICIRLYAEDDFNKRDEFTDPEIMRSNLAGVMLQMKSLRLGEIHDFPFIDPPFHRAVQAAGETLHELGAIDEEGRLTDIGRQLSRLPIDPRIGRMILAGHHENALREVVIIAAALSIRDPRERPVDRQQQADQAHEKFRDEESDFISLLKLWQFYNDQRHKLSRNQLRRACKQNYLSYLRMAEWRDLQRQLFEVCKENKLHIRSKDAKPEAVHRALLTGLLSHVGNLDDPPEYKGAKSKQYYIHPGSALFSQKPKWIMSAELVETTRLYARTNAKIRMDWLEALAGHVVKKHYSEPYYDEEMAQVSAYERVSLYGLTIVARRQVHYGPIDPTASREIFIREGLADFIYESEGKFWKHNRDLVRSIDKLGAKGRRHDVMADIEARFDFYDQRLPVGIYNKVTFETWRKEAEKNNGKLLYMTREDLIQEDTEWITKDKYPERLGFGRSSFKLSYHFEPGHDEDGVTVVVPAPALKQLNPEQLEWLVPGLLEQKVAGLLKSLPKRLRRMFNPNEKYAAMAAEALDFGKGSILDQMAAWCTQTCTYPVKRDEFQLEKLEYHLRMRIVALDEKNEVVAAGRDLQTVITEAGHGAGGALLEEKKSKYQREGLTRWDFGDLPRVVTVNQAGARMEAFPVLVDKGATVSMTVVDHPERAKILHRGGVRRLCVMACEKELAWQIDQSLNVNALALKSTPMYNSASLKADLMGGLAERAFMGEEAVRRQGEYEQSLDGGWHRLNEEAKRLGQQTTALLAQWKQVQQEMKALQNPAYGPALSDLKGQTAWMIYGGFISRTPVASYARLGDYLKSMLSRIEKLKNGGVGKDRQRLDQFMPLWQATKSRMQDHQKRGVYDPELTRYRWMLEEYRIQLFSQEMRPAMSLSAKRLQEQWRKVMD